MGALTMSKAEREEFLAGVHIGVLSVAVEGNGPLVAPVWYRYEPGDSIRFNTEEHSEKVAAMKAAGRASFLVQTEAPPYTYVAVEGPVSYETPDWERDSVGIAERYLGKEGAQGYLAATGGREGRSASVLVVIKPERWRTTDYRKMGR